jgi:hypothetical protein
MEGLASPGTPCDGPLDARGTVRRGLAPESRNWGAGAQTNAASARTVPPRETENASIRRTARWRGPDRLRTSPQALRRFSQRFGESEVLEADSGRKISRAGHAPTERVFEDGTAGAGARLRRFSHHGPIRILAEPDEGGTRLTVDDWTRDPRPAASPDLGLVHVLRVVGDHGSVSSASAVGKARHVPGRPSRPAQPTGVCSRGEGPNRPRIRRHATIP